MFLGASVRSVQFRLVCTTHAISSITRHYALGSFEKTGLLLMDVRFLKHFETKRSKVISEAKLDVSENESEIKPATHPGPRTPILLVRCDAPVNSESQDPSFKLQRLSLLLSNVMTVNDILFPKLAKTPTAAKSVSPSKTLPGEQRSSDAPALYLTYRERVVELHKAKEDEAKSKVLKILKQVYRKAAREAQQREKNARKIFHLKKEPTERAGPKEKILHAL